MARNHGLWFAVGCDVDGSPQLATLRARTDDCGDLYYYRALAWCKSYCKTARLEQWWPALAAAVRWTGSPEQLRDLWRSCGLVVGPFDQIWNWFDLNGWIIQRAEDQAKRVEKKRAAGRASGAARRKRAKLALVGGERAIKQNRRKHV